MNLIKALTIMAVIILILWFFPPTHKLLTDFYENNVIVQTFVDILIHVVQGIWEGIKTFFAEIF